MYKRLYDNTDDIITIYIDILKGRRKVFPLYTWGSDCYNFNKCLRYLINDKLKLNREESLKTMDTKFFKEYRLKAAITILFKERAIFSAINSAFPEWIVKPWELSHAHPKLWNQRSSYVDSTRWLLEEVLKCNRSEIIENTNYKTFKEYGLWYIGIVDLAIEAFPEHKFKRSEFMHYKRSGKLLEESRSS